MRNSGSARWQASHSSEMRDSGRSPYRSHSARRRRSTRYVVEIRHTQSGTRTSSSSASVVSCSWRISAPHAASGWVVEQFHRGAATELLTLAVKPCVHALIGPRVAEDRCQSGNQLHPRRTRARVVATSLDLSIREAEQFSELTDRQSGEPLLEQLDHGIGAPETSGRLLLQEIAHHVTGSLRLHERAIGNIERSHQREPTSAAGAAPGRNSSVEARTRPRTEDSSLGGHNGRVSHEKKAVSPARTLLSPGRRAAPSSRSPSATSHATGLTHVATVSFLASRAAPSLQFFFALGGGIALARSSARLGARIGYGTALASMLQTVAVMGPARINAPLTQAITAPMMGRLQARGARPLVEFLACLALRLVHYAVLLAAFIFVILGGLDEFTGSYETLTGWLGIVPQGPTAALAVTAAGQFLWAIFFSTVQVAAYRRALGNWPAPARVADDAPPALAAGAERGAGRFDPRAVVLAALLASGLLLASTSWALLLGVTAWLIPAWLFSRPDHDAVPIGLALAGLLAFAALTGGLLSGAGLELTLRRVVRAVLLVAVATWMRAAAGPGGLRETFRRALHRLRAIPAVREAATLMAGLDSGPRLIAAGRAAADRFADVALKPADLADTVTAWVAVESVDYRAGPGVAAPPLRLRAFDGLLVALTFAPALAFVGG